MTHWHLTDKKWVKWLSFTYWLTLMFSLYNYIYMILEVAKDKKISITNFVIWFFFFFFFVSRKQSAQIASWSCHFHFISNLKPTFHQTLSGTGCFPKSTPSVVRVKWPSFPCSSHSCRSTPLNASAFGVTLDSSVKSRPGQQTISTSPGRLQFGVIICYNKLKR